MQGKVPHPDNSSGWPEAPEAHTTLCEVDTGVPPYPLDGMSPAEQQIQSVIDMLSDPKGCDILALKAKLRVFLADPYRQIGKTLDRVHFADNAYVTEAAINLGIAFAMTYTKGFEFIHFHPHDVLTFARKFSVVSSYDKDGKMVLSVEEK